MRKMLLLYPEGEIFPVNADRGSLSKDDPELFNVSFRMGNLLIDV